MTTKSKDATKPPRPRRFIDRQDAAEAGIPEADVQLLEAILEEAGMERMSAADLERQADRILAWARSFGARVAS